MIEHVFEHLRAEKNTFSHLAVCESRKPFPRLALNYQNDGREFREVVENLSWAALKNGRHVSR